jgi:hypothetical protein
MLRVLIFFTAQSDFFLINVSHFKEFEFWQTVGEKVLGISEAIFHHRQREYRII